jgi:hypothetical protein
MLSASGSERATTVLSKTAWYSFREQPGIRFKSSLVSGSLRSFRHDGWGRRATTPDVATARRRRAADCARREGLPTVDRPFAPYAPPLAYGTSGLHGRCDGPPFMRARACTPCPRCCGMPRLAAELASAPGASCTPARSPTQAHRTRDLLRLTAAADGQLDAVAARAHTGGHPHPQQIRPGPQLPAPRRQLAMPLAPAARARSPPC